MALSKRERVLRAIYRQQLDYFPSQIDFTSAASRSFTREMSMSDNQLNELLDNHLVDSYSLGAVEEYLQNPPVLQRALDLGLARLDRQSHMAYDLWGVGWDMVPDGGWPGVHPLKDLDAYPHYQFPDPYHPHLMDLVKETVEEYQGQYFVLASHHTALFERAWALRGFENALMDFIINPQFTEELYDRITEYQVVLARRFVSQGIDGVRVGDDYGTQQGLIMKPDLWRKVIKPRLKRIWAVYQAANIPVIHHTCGNVRDILDDFVEMGLNVLHPIQPMAMSLAEVGNRYSNSLSFYGGIDTQQILPYGTPEEVAQSVQDCIEFLGHRGGYIISPAQAIMEDVPSANIQALIQAIQKHQHQDT